MLVFVIPPPPPPPQKMAKMEVKGATSRFVHLENFGLNFSSSSFAIRVNLLHP